MKEQPKKKRASRPDMRVSGLTKEDGAKLHAIAKSRGLTFSGMIRHDYLKHEVEPVLTPWQERLSEHFEALWSLYKKIDDVLIGVEIDLKNELLSTIIDNFKATLKAFNDTKRKSAPKRKRAG